jgi:predicted NBD/HSP70 family sugar kinase
VGVGDPNGCLLGEQDIREVEQSLDDVRTATLFPRVAKLVGEQLEHCDVTPQEIRAVAISIPAPVSKDGRTLSKDVLRTFHGVDIPDRLGRSLSKFADLSPATPVIVENDVDSLARGESRYGKAFGLDDFAVVKCSGGVGAAIVSNAHLVRGRSGGGAGEIGHCSIDPAILSAEENVWEGLDSPPPCRCGGLGHLEAYAGGEAIVTRIAQLDPKMLSDEPLSKRLDRAIECADQEGVARRVIADAGAMIGLAVNTLIHLFNPELLLVGGKMSEMGAPFLAAVRDECNEQGVLFGSVDDIVQLATGATAQERRRIGVRGAITTALRRSDSRLSFVS